MDENVHVIKFDPESLEAINNLSSSIDRLYNQLGIPHQLFDERRDMERNIFANMISSFITGR